MVDVLDHERVPYVLLRLARCFDSGDLLLHAATDQRWLLLLLLRQLSVVVT